MCENKKDQLEVSDSSTSDDLPEVDDLVSQIFAGWAQPEGSKAKSFDYDQQQQGILSYLGILLEELFDSQFPDGDVQVLSYCDFNLTDFVEDAYDSKLCFFAKASAQQFCLISSSSDSFYSKAHPSFQELSLELISQMNDRIFTDFSISLKYHKSDLNLTDLQVIETEQDCLLYSLEISLEFKKFRVLVVFSRSLIDLLIA